ncbi:MAG: hypothetical protein ABI604_15750, partial [Nitrospirota bacterium]
WSIAPVLKTGDPQGSVGSNPTPSAMSQNRPPTFIDTGAGVFSETTKKPIFGQVSLKLSLLGGEVALHALKEVTTPRLLGNSFSWASVEFLHDQTKIHAEKNTPNNRCRAPKNP